MFDAPVTSKERVWDTNNRHPGHLINDLEFGTDILTHAFCPIETSM